MRLENFRVIECTSQKIKYIETENMVPIGMKMLIHCRGEYREISSCNFIDRFDNWSRDLPGTGTRQPGIN